MKEMKVKAIKLEIDGHLKSFFQVLLYSQTGNSVGRTYLEKVNLLNDFISIGFLPSLSKHKSECFLSGMFEIYYMKIYTESGMARASRIFDLLEMLCKVMPKINKTEGIKKEDVVRAEKEIASVWDGQGTSDKHKLATIIKMLKTNYCVTVQAMLAALLDSNILGRFFPEQEENAFTGEGCVMCNIDKNILKEDG